MPVARSRVSCAPKLDLPERAQQIFQRLESQKIDGLIGHLEIASWYFGVALAARARSPDRAGGYPMLI